MAGRSSSKHKTRCCGNDDPCCRYGSHFYDRPPGSRHPTARHTGSCNIICCHFGTAFGVRALRSCKRTSQRGVPGILAAPSVLSLALGRRGKKCAKVHLRVPRRGWRRGVPSSDGACAAHERSQLHLGTPAVGAWPGQGGPPQTQCRRLPAVSLPLTALALCSVPPYNGLLQTSRATGTSPMLCECHTIFREGCSNAQCA